jgi:hypothetical protein
MTEFAIATSRGNRAISPLFANDGATPARWCQTARPRGSVSLGHRMVVPTLRQLPRPGTNRYGRRRWRSRRSWRAANRGGTGRPAPCRSASSRPGRSRSGCVGGRQPRRLTHHHALRPRPPVPRPTRHLHRRHLRRRCQPLNEERRRRQRQHPTRPQRLGQDPSGHAAVHVRVLDGPRRVLSSPISGNSRNSLLRLHDNRQHAFS